MPFKTSNKGGKYVEAKENVLPEGWDEEAWRQSFAENGDFRSGTLLVCASLRKEDWQAVRTLTEHLILGYRSLLAPYLLWLHSTALRMTGHEQEAREELTALEESFQCLSSPHFAVLYAPLRAAVLRQTGRNEEALLLIDALKRAAEGEQRNPAAAASLRSRMEEMRDAFETSAAPG